MLASSRHRRGIESIVDSVAAEAPGMFQRRSWRRSGSSKIYWRVD